MTAVQHVFSKLEKLHPELFDIHTEKGRNFIDNFSKFLEIENQQFKDFFAIGYYAHFIGLEKTDEKMDYFIKDYKKR
jgi:hypothetical protein